MYSHKLSGKQSATSVKLETTYKLYSAIPVLTIYPTDIKKVCARKMTSFGKSVEPKLSYTPDRSVNWYNHLENLLVKCLLNLNICIHCEVPLLVHALQRCRHMFTRRNVEEY